MREAREMDGAAAMRCEGKDEDSYKRDDSTPLVRRLEVACAYCGILWVVVQLFFVLRGARAASDDVKRNVHHPPSGLSTLCDCAYVVLGFFGKIVTFIIGLLLFGLQVTRLQPHGSRILTWYSDTSTSALSVCCL